MWTTTLQYTNQRNRATRKQTSAIWRAMYESRGLDAQKAEPYCDTLRAQTVWSERLNRNEYKCTLFSLPRPTIFTNQRRQQKKKLLTNILSLWAVNQANVTDIKMGHSISSGDKVQCTVKPVTRHETFCMRGEGKRRAWPPE